MLTNIYQEGSISDHSKKKFRSYLENWPSYRNFYSAKGIFRKISKNEIPNLKLLTGCIISYTKSFKSCSVNITPLFYCKFLFYYQNKDVYKKPDLNMSRIDRAIPILSSKFHFCKFFGKFPSPNKNCDNSVNFQDMIKKFFLNDH